MTEYVEDTGLNDAFTAVLNNKAHAELSPLRENKIRITPLMRIKTNKDGDHQPSSGPPAVMKKVSDLFKAAGVDADYVLVVDYYAWNHPKGINPAMAQEAYIHHALMTVEVEKVEDKTGQTVVKVASRDPDVSEFIATAKHYGGFDEDQITFGNLVLAGAKSMKQITSGSLEQRPQVESGTTPPVSGESPDELPTAPPDEPLPTEEPTPRRRGRAK